MIIADTDIFISAIRGNEIAKQLLSKYHNQINLSIITQIELLVGSNNPTKKKIVENILNLYLIISINKSICSVAIQLIKIYNTQSKNLQLADAFIAASCIDNNFKLLTFNTSDFNFIKGVQLAK